MEPTRSTNGSAFDATPLAGVRVALFTGAYNHIRDGVSLTLNRLVAHLERRGAEVLVFAPTIPEPVIDHNGTLEPVPSIPMPGRGEYRLTIGLTRSQVQRLRSFSPHIMHVATPDFAGLQAARLSRSLGVPLVSSYHTHFSSYLEYYRLEWLEGYLWRRLRTFHGMCRQTYVPTPTIASILEEKGITNGLRLWPRGVERVRPERPSRISCRTRYSWVTRKVSILRVRTRPRTCSSFRASPKRSAT
jgi:glycosyltransferase involved in cell wall biosynthesis